MNSHCDCEKPYHAVNGDPCNIKDQLGHKESVKNSSLTVVYSVGSSVKVAGEILYRDRVRDTRSVSRMIQSGSHKIITETGINPSHAN
jgi:hypothetical protein